MIKSNETAPCPFCGSEDIIVNHSGIYYIFCVDCEACGPLATTQEQAIGSWNRRQELFKECNFDEES